MKYNAVGNSSVEEQIEFVSSCIKQLHIFNDLISFLKEKQEDYDLLDRLEDFCLLYTEEKLEYLKYSGRSNIVGTDRPLVKLGSATTCIQRFYRMAYDYQNAYIPLTARQLNQLCIDCVSIIADLAYGLLKVFELDNEELDGASDSVFISSCNDAGLVASEVAVNIVKLAKDYPTNLPLLEEHPEYILLLGNVVSAEMLELIIDYGEVLNREEVENIINGTLEVNEEFIRDLESRTEDEI